MTSLRNLLLGAPDRLARHLDQEYERYVLLAYLQHVGRRFGERKLYPHLDELYRHMAELDRLRSQRAALERDLSREVVGIDMDRMELVRRRKEEQVLLDGLDDLVELALPELRQMHADGSALREELFAQIRFGPVGILPLRAREGYLVLRQGREARVYAYDVPLYREHEERTQYRSVHTRYVTTCTMRPAQGYSSIRTSLLGRDPMHPHPAVFAFECEVEIPWIESYMPIAKQLVYEHLERTSPPGQ